MLAPETLGEMKFFEELSSKHIERLATIGEVKAYPKGVFLDKNRRHANHLYVIMDGSISLQIESLTGKTIRLETVSAGGAIGFSSLIETHDKGYTSDAMLLTPAKLLRFKADELKLLFYQDFELGFLIMKKIAYVVKRRLMYRTLPIVKMP